MPKLSLTREYSAGGVVYRRDNGKLLWLVQERAAPTSMKLRGAEAGYWQLPKGHIEQGETPEQAAVREVEEESGIVGRIVIKLSPIEYFFVLNGKRIFKHVTWFLMEYKSGSTDNFDPKEVSAAKFVPFDEAYELIKYPTEKKVLKEADTLARTGDFAARIG